MQNHIKTEGIIKIAVNVEHFKESILVKISLNSDYLLETYKQNTDRGIWSLQLHLFNGKEFSKSDFRYGIPVKSTFKKSSFKLPDMEILRIRMN